MEPTRDKPLVIKDVIIHEKGAGHLDVCPNKEPPSKRRLVLYHLDKDYSVAHSRNFAKDLKLYISGTTRNLRETPRFIRKLRGRIISLHNYNTAVAKALIKYPAGKTLLRLLIRYVELELEVRNRREYNCDVYKKQVDVRILRLLVMIYSSFCENYLKIPKENKDKELWRLVWKVLTGVRSELRHGAEDIAQAVLKKLDIFEETESLKGTAACAKSNETLKHVQEVLHTKDYFTESEDEESDFSDEELPFDFERLGIPRPPKPSRRKKTKNSSNINNLHLDSNYRHPESCPDILLSNPGEDEEFFLRHAILPDPLDDLPLCHDLKSEPIDEEICNENSYDKIEAIEILDDSDDSNVEHAFYEAVEVPNSQRTIERLLEKEEEVICVAEERRKKQEKVLAQCFNTHRPQIDHVKSELMEDESVNVSKEENVQTLSGMVNHNFQHGINSSGGSPNYVVNSQNTLEKEQNSREYRKPFSDFVCGGKAVAEVIKAVQNTSDNVENAVSELSDKENKQHYSEICGISQNISEQPATRLECPTINGPKTDVQNKNFSLEKIKNNKQNTSLETTEWCQSLSEATNKGCQPESPEIHFTKASSKLLVNGVVGNTIGKGRADNYLKPHSRVIELETSHSKLKNGRGHNSEQTSVAKKHKYVLKSGDVIDLDTDSDDDVLHSDFKKETLAVLKPEILISSDEESEPIVSQHLSESMILESGLVDIKQELDDSSDANNDGSDKNSRSKNFKINKDKETTKKNKEAKEKKCGSNGVLNNGKVLKCSDVIDISLDEDTYIDIKTDEKIDGSNNEILNLCSDDDDLDYSLTVADTAGGNNDQMDVIRKNQIMDNLASDLDHYECGVVSEHGVSKLTKLEIHDLEDMGAWQESNIFESDYVKESHFEDILNYELKDEYNKCVEFEKKYEIITGEFYLKQQEVVGELDLGTNSTLQTYPLQRSVDPVERISEKFTAEFTLDNGLNQSDFGVQIGVVTTESQKSIVSSDLTMDVLETMQLNGEVDMPSSNKSTEQVFVNSWVEQNATKIEKDTGEEEPSVEPSKDTEIVELLHTETKVGTEVVVKNLGYERYGKIHAEVLENSLIDQDATKTRKNTELNAESSDTTKTVEDNEKLLHTEIEVCSKVVIENERSGKINAEVLVNSLTDQNATKTRKDKELDAESSENTKEGNEKLLHKETEVCSTVVTGNLENKGSGKINAEVLVISPIEHNSTKTRKNKERSVESSENNKTVNETEKLLHTETKVFREVAIKNLKNERSGRINAETLVNSLIDQNATKTLKNTELCVESSENTKTVRENEKMLHTEPEVFSKVVIENLENGRSGNIVAGVLENLLIDQDAMKIQKGTEKEKLSIENFENSKTVKENERLNSFSKVCSKVVIKNLENSRSSKIDAEVLENSLIDQNATQIRKDTNEKLSVESYENIETVEENEKLLHSEREICREVDIPNLEYEGPGKINDLGTEDEKLSVQNLEDERPGKINDPLANEFENSKLNEEPCEEISEDKKKSENPVQSDDIRGQFSETCVNNFEETDSEPNIGVTSENENARELNIKTISEYEYVLSAKCDSADDQVEASVGTEEIVLETKSMVENVQENLEEKQLELQPENEEMLYFEQNNVCTESSQDVTEITTEDTEIAHEVESEEILQEEYIFFEESTTEEVVDTYQTIDDDKTNKVHLLNEESNEDIDKLKQDIDKNDETTTDTSSKDNQDSLLNASCVVQDIPILPPVVPANFEILHPVKSVDVSVIQPISDASNIITPDNINLPHIPSELRVENLEEKIVQLTKIGTVITKATDQRQSIFKNICTQNIEMLELPNKSQSLNKENDAKSGLVYLATCAAGKKKMPIRKNENKRGKAAKIKGHVKTNNRRVTRSKKNEENTVSFNPHDFISPENSSLIPKNNVFAHKLLNVPVHHSEDSNDSEGHLLIDEGITNNEKVIVESIVDAESAVHLSIPETCEFRNDSLEILKQIEKLNADKITGEIKKRGRGRPRKIKTSPEEQKTVLDLSVTTPRMQPIKPQNKFFIDSILNDAPFITRYSKPQVDLTVNIKNNFKNRVSGNLKKSSRKPKSPTKLRLVEVESENLNFEKKHNSRKSKSPSKLSLHKSTDIDSVALPREIIFKNMDLIRDMTVSIKNGELLKSTSSLFGHSNNMVTAGLPTVEQQHVDSTLTPVMQEMTANTNFMIRDLKTKPNKVGDYTTINHNSRGSEYCSVQVLSESLKSTLILKDCAEWQVSNTEPERETAPNTEPTKPPRVPSILPEEYSTTKSPENTSTSSCQEYPLQLSHGVPNIETSRSTECADANVAAAANTNFFVETLHGYPSSYLANSCDSQSDTSPLNLVKKTIPSNEDAQTKVKPVIERVSEVCFTRNTSVEPLLVKNQEETDSSVTEVVMFKVSEVPVELVSSETVKSPAQTLTVISEVSEAPEEVSSLKIIKPLKTKAALKAFDKCDLDINMEWLNLDCDKRLKGLELMDRNNCITRSKSLDISSLNSCVVNATKICEMYKCLKESTTKSDQDEISKGVNIDEDILKDNVPVKNITIAVLAQLDEDDTPLLQRKVVEPRKKGAKIYGVSSVVVKQRSVRKKSKINKSKDLLEQSKTSDSEQNIQNDLLIDAKLKKSQEVNKSEDSLEETSDMRNESEIPNLRKAYAIRVKETCIKRQETGLISNKVTTRRKSQSKFEQKDDKELLEKQKSSKSQKASKSKDSLEETSDMKDESDTVPNLRKPVISEKDTFIEKQQTDLTSNKVTTRRKSHSKFEQKDDIETSKVAGNRKSKRTKQNKNERTTVQAEKSNLENKNNSKPVIIDKILIEEISEQESTGLSFETDIKNMKQQPEKNLVVEKTISDSTKSNKQYATRSKTHSLTLDCFSESDDSEIEMKRVPKIRRSPARSIANDNNKTLEERNTRLRRKSEQHVVEQSNSKNVSTLQAKPTDTCLDVILPKHFETKYFIPPKEKFKRDYKAQQSLLINENSTTKDSFDDASKNTVAIVSNPLSCSLPPKFRRKSFTLDVKLNSNEVTTNKSIKICAKDIVSSNMSVLTGSLLPSTAILSKCKNTVAVTAEKLKKKLESDLRSFPSPESLYNIKSIYSDTSEEETKKMDSIKERRKSHQNKKPGVEVSQNFVSNNLSRKKSLSLEDDDSLDNVPLVKIKEDICSPEKNSLPKTSDKNPVVKPRLRKQYEKKKISKKFSKKITKDVNREKNQKSFTIFDEITKEADREMQMSSCGVNLTSRKEKSVKCAGEITKKLELRSGDRDIKPRKRGLEMQQDDVTNLVESKKFKSVDEGKQVNKIFSMEPIKCSLNIANLQLDVQFWKRAIILNKGMHDVPKSDEHEASKGLNEHELLHKSGDLNNQNSTRRENEVLSECTIEFSKDFVSLDSHNSKPTQDENELLLVEPRQGETELLAEDTTKLHEVLGDLYYQQLTQGHSELLPEGPNNIHEAFEELPNQISTEGEDKLLPEGPNNDEASEDLKDQKPTQDKIEVLSGDTHYLPKKFDPQSHKDSKDHSQKLIQVDNRLLPAGSNNLHQASKDLNNQKPTKDEIEVPSGDTNNVPKEYCSPKNKQKSTKGEDKLLPEVPSNLDETSEDLNIREATRDKVDVRSKDTNKLPKENSGPESHKDFKDHSQKPTEVDNKLLPGAKPSQDDIEVLFEDTNNVPKEYGSPENNQKPNTVEDKLPAQVSNNLQEGSGDLSNEKPTQVKIEILSDGTNILHKDYSSSESHKGSKDHSKTTTQADNELLSEGSNNLHQASEDLKNQKPTQDDIKVLSKLPKECETKYNLVTCDKKSEVLSSSHIECNVDSPKAFEIVTVEDEITKDLLEETHRVFIEDTEDPLSYENSVPSNDENFFEIENVDMNVESECCASSLTEEIVETETSDDACKVENPVAGHYNECSAVHNSKKDENSLVRQEDLGEALPNNVQSSQEASRDSNVNMISKSAGADVEEKVNIEPITTNEKVVLESFKNPLESSIIPEEVSSAESREISECSEKVLGNIQESESDVLGKNIVDLNVSLMQQREGLVSDSSCKSELTECNEIHDMKMDDVPFKINESISSESDMLYDKDEDTVTTTEEQEKSCDLTFNNDFQDKGLENVFEESRTNKKLEITVHQVGGNTTVPRNSPTTFAPSKSVTEPETVKTSETTLIPPRHIILEEHNQIEVGHKKSAEEMCSTTTDGEITLQKFHENDFLSTKRDMSKSILLLETSLDNLGKEDDLEKRCDNLYTIKEKVTEETSDKIQVKVVEKVKEQTLPVQEKQKVSFKPELASNSDENVYAEINTRPVAELKIEKCETLLLTSSVSYDSVLLSESSNYNQSILHKNLVPTEITNDPEFTENIVKYVDTSVVEVVQNTFSDSEIQADQKLLSPTILEGGIEEISTSQDRDIEKTLLVTSSVSYDSVLPSEPSTYNQSVLHENLVPTEIRKDPEFTENNIKYVDTSVVEVVQNTFSDSEIQADQKLLSPTIIEGGMEEISASPDKDIQKTLLVTPSVSYGSVLPSESSTYNQSVLHENLVPTDIRNDREFTENIVKYVDTSVVEVVQNTFSDSEIQADQKLLSPTILEVGMEEISASQDRDIEKTLLVTSGASYDSVLPSEPSTYNQSVLHENLVPTEIRKDPEFTENIVKYVDTSVVEVVQDTFSDSEIQADQKLLSPTILEGGIEEISTSQDRDIEKTLLVTSSVSYDSVLPSEPSTYNQSVLHENLVPTEIRKDPEFTENNVKYVDTSVVEVVQNTFSDSEIQADQKLLSPTILEGGMEEISASQDRDIEKTLLVTPSVSYGSVLPSESSTYNQSVLHENLVPTEIRKDREFTENIVKYVDTSVVEVVQNTLSGSEIQADQKLLSPTIIEGVMEEVSTSQDMDIEKTLLVTSSVSYDSILPSESSNCNQSILHENLVPTEIRKDPEFSKNIVKYVDTSVIEVVQNTFSESEIQADLKILSPTILEGGKEEICTSQDRDIENYVSKSTSKDASEIVSNTDKATSICQETSETIIRDDLNSKNLEPPKNYKNEKRVIMEEGSRDHIVETNIAIIDKINDQLGSENVIKKNSLTCHSNTIITTNGENIMSDFFKEESLLQKVKFLKEVSELGDKEQHETTETESSIVNGSIAEIEGNFDETSTAKLNSTTFLDTSNKGDEVSFTYRTATVFPKVVTESSKEESKDLKYVEVQKNNTNRHDASERIEATFNMYLSPKTQSGISPENVNQEEIENTNQSIEELPSYATLEEKKVPTRRSSREETVKIIEETFEKYLCPKSTNMNYNCDENTTAFETEAEGRNMFLKRKNRNESEGCEHVKKLRSNELSLDSHDITSDTHKETLSTVNVNVLKKKLSLKIKDINGSSAGKKVLSKKRAGKVTTKPASNPEERSSHSENKQCYQQFVYQQLPSTSTASQNSLNISKLLVDEVGDSSNVSNYEEISTQCNTSNMVLTSPCATSAETMQLLNSLVTSQADMCNSDNMILQNSDSVRLKMQTQDTDDLDLSLPLQDICTNEINDDFSSEDAAASNHTQIFGKIILDSGDHNYTPFGGPLLGGGGGRHMDNNILSTNFDVKDLNSGDSPEEFPLKLDLAFAESNLEEIEIMQDDFVTHNPSYKLTLDNAYAVNNLVMLGSQTTGDTSNAFPLTNYNLADIENMNLIECSNATEENSNSNHSSIDNGSIVGVVSGTAMDLGNIEQATTWSQLISNENNRYQKVVVIPIEQCTTPNFEANRNNFAETFQISMEDEPLKFNRQKVIKTEDEDVDNKVTEINLDCAMETNRPPVTPPTPSLVVCKKVDTPDVSDKLVVRESTGTSPANDLVDGNKATDKVKRKIVKMDPADTNRSRKFSKVATHHKVPEQALETPVIPSRRYGRSIVTAPPPKIITRASTSAAVSNPPSLNTGKSPPVDTATLINVPTIATTDTVSSVVTEPPIHSHSKNKKSTPILPSDTIPKDSKNNDTKKITVKEKSPSSNNVEQDSSDTKIITNKSNIPNNSFKLESIPKEEQNFETIPLMLPTTKKNQVTIAKPPTANLNSSIDSSCTSDLLNLPSKYDLIKLRKRNPIVKNDHSIDSILREPSTVKCKGDNSSSKRKTSDQDTSSSSSLNKKCKGGSLERDKVFDKLKDEGNINKAFPLELTGDKLKPVNVNQNPKSATVQKSVRFSLEEDKKGHYTDSSSKLSSNVASSDNERSKLTTTGVVNVERAKRSAPVVPSAVGGSTSNVTHHDFSQGQALRSSRSSSRHSGGAGSSNVPSTQLPQRHHPYSNDGSSNLKVHGNDVTSEIRALRRNNAATDETPQLSVGGIIGGCDSRNGGERQYRVGSRRSTEKRVGEDWRTGGGKRNDGYTRNSSSSSLRSSASSSSTLHNVYSNYNSKSAHYMAHLPPRQSERYSEHGSHGSRTAHAYSRSIHTDASRRSSGSFDHHYPNKTVSHQTSTYTRPRRSITTYPYGRDLKDLPNVPKEQMTVQLKDTGLDWISEFEGKVDKEQLIAKTAKFSGPQFMSGTKKCE